MRYRTGHRDRGSVIIMVVGIVLLLGMLGSTFVIISFADRKESRSIAMAAPMNPIAWGAAERLRTMLVKDLYIDNAGRIYGLADTDAKTIDYASQDTDPHLAAMVMTGGVWSSITNLYNGPRAQFENVSDAELVDTDGDDVGDSRLVPSGVFNRVGDQYHIAVRLVDLGGKVNANTACMPHKVTGQPWAGYQGAWTYVNKRYMMPIVNVSLGVLPGSNYGFAINVQNERRSPASHNMDKNIGVWAENYTIAPRNWRGRGNPNVRKWRPFDSSDLLAVLWQGKWPNANRGRLRKAMGAGFPTAKPYLTTWSTYRTAVIGARAKRNQTQKIDLNRDYFWDLYNAFYNLLAGSASENERRTMAAQLTLNVQDFRDADSNVRQRQVPGVTGTFVYGVERQPFIVEAAYKHDKTGPSLVGYYAIELFNPYKTGINLNGWRIKCGAATFPLSGSINGTSRRVIYSRSGVQFSGANNVMWNQLDLQQEVQLQRRVGGSGTYITVDQVSPEDFLNDPTSLPTGEPGDTVKLESIRREDNLPSARYSLSLYKSAELDITNAVSSNLGSVNLVITTAEPCPIFVRNAPFINVGEICRIFAIGPDKDESLVSKLTSFNSPYNGRLSPAGPVIIAAGIPAVPWFCMVSEWLMVDSPRRDNWDNDNDGVTDTNDANGGEDIVYGWININTAPAEVIAALPSLAVLPQAERDAIVQSIIDYRENVAGARAGLGMAGLRTDKGFAAAGEIVLPSLRAAELLGLLPNNKYTDRSPDAYAVDRVVAGPRYDDGLSFAAADAVKNDATKRLIHYAWMSNHIAVRSDSYAAYIRVQASDRTDETTFRRYVVVIDRSNCQTVTDRPDIIMFAEIKG